MMDAFKLTLIRHGETLENKLKIIQGHQDTILSEKGIRQARLLAQKLETEIFSHVFSSDLSRARQTCEIIMSQNKNSQTQIKTDTRLRERKLGILEGQHVSSCRGHLKSDSKQSSAGMETKQQLRQHAKSFFKELCTNIQRNYLLMKDNGSSRETNSSPFCIPYTDSFLSSGARPEVFGDKVSGLEGGAVELHANPITLATSNNCGTNTAATVDVEELSTLLSVSSAGNGILPDSEKGIHCDISDTVPMEHNSNKSHGVTVLNLKHQVKQTPKSNRGLGNVLPTGTNSNAECINIGSDLSMYNILASVLIVSHGGFLMELIAFFVKELKCKLSESQKAISHVIPNAGISRFVVTVGESDKVVPKVFCLSPFETDHLVAEGEDTAPLTSSAADCI